MNEEQLKGLGAVISKASVPYSTKVWGEGKSVGGDWVIDIDIAPGSDAEAAIAGAYAWLKELAHKLMGEELKEVETRKPATTGAPVAQQQQANGIEEVVLEDPLIGNVMLSNGEHACKIFGGNWKKYGVNLWPDVLQDIPELEGFYANTPPVTINKDGVEQAQWLTGLPYPYTKAVVQVVDGKPKRVLRLEQ